MKKDQGNCVFLPFSFAKRKEYGEGVCVQKIRALEGLCDRNRAVRVDEVGFVAQGIPLINNARMMSV